LQEVASSLINAKVDSKCSIGSSCTGKGSGGEKCSKNYIIEYATKKKGTFQIEEILRDMYEGKICTCKNNSAGASFKLISPGFVILTSLILYIFI
jgi:hypothetical protein